MKKVGIVTFHRAENFGAVMQAFALQETLKELGVKPYIIDYRNSNIEAQYHIFNPSILFTRKNIFASLIQYFSRFHSLKSRRLKKNKYCAFRERYLNIRDISEWENSDIIITGSDQVWNLHLTGGYDNYYFLDLPSVPGQKRIAYAASSDNDPDDLLFKEVNNVRNALKKFDFISVREDFLKKSLSRFIDNDIEVVLDPTLLLDDSKYDEIAVKPKEDNYVCVYHMTPTDESRRLAKRIANDKGLKIIELFGGYNSNKISNTYKTYISPTELLGYLRYAKAIVTTSFHGIAFSVKFHKDFWVVDKGDNFRQKNILSLLGISDRLIYNSEEVNMVSIDYNKVDKRLRLAKEKSISFLTKSIE